MKMLDLRTNKIRWEDNVKSGVCALLLSIVLMLLLTVVCCVVLSQIVGLEFDRKDIQMNKLVCTTLESRSGSLLIWIWFHALHCTDCGACRFRVFDLRTQHPEQGFASLTEKVCARACLVSFIQFGVSCCFSPWLYASGARLHNLDRQAPAAEPVRTACLLLSTLD